MRGVRGYVKRFPQTTARDVAERVGMSLASVSMVLSGALGLSAATRQRGAGGGRRARLPPRPDGQPAAWRRTHLVGVLMQVGSPFHAELVEDLHEAAEGRGYDVVLSTVTCTRDERRATETLVDFRCEALVLLGPVALAAQLAALGRQLLCVIGRRVAGRRVDVVRTADAEGVGQVVDHLATLGHRSITYVDGGRDDRRRLPPRLPRGHAPPRPGRPGSGSSCLRPYRGGRQPGGRTPLDGGVLPGAVVAYNDSCAPAAGRLQPGRGRGPRRRLRWPATTTAAWPGSPT